MLAVAETPAEIVAAVQASLVQGRRPVSRGEGRAPALLRQLLDGTLAASDAAAQVSHG
jgi:hypothetical protein